MGKVRSKRKTGQRLVLALQCRLSVYATIKKAPVIIPLKWPVPEGRKVGQTNRGSKTRRGANNREVWISVLCKSCVVKRGPFPPPATTLPAHRALGRDAELELEDPLLLVGPLDAECRAGRLLVRRDGIHKSGVPQVEEGLGEDAVGETFALQKKTQQKST